MAKCFYCQINGSRMCGPSCGLCGNRCPGYQKEEGE